MCCHSPSKSVDMFNSDRIGICTKKKYLLGGYLVDNLKYRLKQSQEVRLSSSNIDI